MEDGKENEFLLTKEETELLERTLGRPLPRSMDRLSVIDPEAFEILLIVREAGLRRAWKAGGEE
ncbi:MAG: hypothetical protein VST70_01125 [Nitrospirota bacterium]|nr:hypothetical protein [Nitrospirota bacterium]